MSAGHDLSALVGSRLCHDLVGPLGAIGNGIELLALVGDARGEEMALISESVADATARLRFFRVAYGHAAPGQTIGRGEILQTLAAVSRSGRLSFFWNVEDDQPRDEVRAVFLALQCLETFLPRGGEVQVERAAGQWTITGEGTQLHVDDALWATLSTPQPGQVFAPAQVQFALLPQVVAGLGRSLTTDTAEGRVTLQL